jgi:hypothetical protein
MYMVHNFSEISPEKKIRSGQNFQPNLAQPASLRLLSPNWPELALPMLIIIIIPLKPERNPKSPNFSHSFTRVGLLVASSTRRRGTTLAAGPPAPKAACLHRLLPPFHLSAATRLVRGGHGCWN